MSSLCDYAHTVEHTSRKCVVRKKNSVVGVGERAGGTYSVNLRREGDRLMVTIDVNGYMLSNWHASLTHVDQNAINKMPQSGGVHGMEMAEGLNMNMVSPFVQGAMMNKPKRWRATLETRLCAVVHTYIAEMNVPSISAAEYFVTFIDESFGHDRLCHMKTREEAADLLKQHGPSVERETDCRVKKSFLMGARNMSKEQRNWEQTVLNFTLLQATPPRKVDMRRE